MCLQSGAEGSASLSTHCGPEEDGEDETGMFGLLKVYTEDTQRRLFGVVEGGVQ